MRTLFDLTGNGSAADGTSEGAAPEPVADDRPAAAADDPPGATVHHLRGTGTDDA